MAVDDAFTVALLHMNGTDTSTTFTDESGKTWTARGNAQIATAQSKFGGASGVFDGTGDYVDTPDHANWQLDGGSNSNEWTIDFWVRFNGDPGTTQMGIVQQYADNNNFWVIYLNSVNALVFQVRASGSNTVLLSNSWDPADATWYHIAVVKQGATGYKMFVDGTQIGSTQTDTDTIPDFAGALRVGRVTTGTGSNSDLNGWIDELRISKGVARWTGNFTPPTAEYAAAASGGAWFAFAGS